MDKKIVSIIVASSTIIVFLLTLNPATRAAVNSLFAFYVVIPAIGFIYYPFLRSHISNQRLISTYLYIIFISILLWVGVTGWFLSPFFYLLYLLAIVLSFAYSPLVTLVFVIVLLGLFAPNIGSIDLTIDIITMISLFSVVPLTYFLQKEYLRLKQSENKVLVLEEERQKLENTVDEVLRNKVIKFAVDIRQPANDIKQIALVAQREYERKKGTAAFKKVVRLAEKTLKTIEEFEEKVTGKKLVHTKKSTKGR